MTEEACVDHLFKGVNAALYERLYVLGIKTCDEFHEKARLHEDAVRTAYERILQGSSSGRGKRPCSGFEEADSRAEGTLIENVAHREMGWPGK